MGDRWIQTRDGNVFDFNNPKPESISLDEIAHSLAIQNRFNGHTRFPYSVAQHSINVSRLLEEWGERPEVLLAGLMHDAAEAYTGDLISPLKRGDEHFQLVELLATKAVADTFFLLHPMPEIVKKADMVMLMVERRDLLAKPPKPWFEDEDKIELPSWGVGEAWRWADAKYFFLKRFEELS